MTWDCHNQCVTLQVKFGSVYKQGLRWCKNCKQATNEIRCSCCGALTRSKGRRKTW